MNKNGKSHVTKPHAWPIMFIDFLELSFSQIAKCGRNDTYDGSLAVLLTLKFEEIRFPSNGWRNEWRNPKEGNFLYSVYKTDVTAHKLQTFRTSIWIPSLMN